MKFHRQVPAPTEFWTAIGVALSGGAYHKSIFKIEPRDVWVGVYWDATNIEKAYAEDFVRSTHRWYVNVYVCPLPCCLIRFAVEFGTPKWKRGDYTDFNAGRDKTNAEIARRAKVHAPINMPEDRSGMIAKAVAADDGACSTGGPLT